MPRTLRHRLVPLLLALALALVVTACKADPLERRIERTDSLVELLETHRDDPETLLAELEDFVAEHDGEWRAETAEIEALDEAERIRLTSVYDDRFKLTYGRLFDAQLYIQDHWGESDPEKLARFLDLMDELAGQK